NAEVVADISEPPVEKENTFKLVVEVRNIKDSTTWKEVSGKAIIYLQKDSFSSGLHYGDRLFISSDFSEVRSPQNPSEFNYKKYLSNRFVYHQSYVKSGKWKLVSRDHGNIFMTAAINIRNLFLGIFRDNKITGREYAVSSALILGYTDKIDPELMKDYSNVGVIHILSVSGMHVGVIFLVLNYLLFFFEKFRHGKIIKTIILLLLIWLYAMITGLSPAVLRAAAMFSFIAAGRSFNRQVNIFNSLAASAFLLLMINPFFLADVGFQLSYLAVVGIIIIQPFLSSLWYPGNWFLKQAWGITVVSVAAQIATFPLSIMYFHQFPNYFLVSNLIVIPFSNFIIYSGMLVLFTAPIGWLSMIFS
ncbi:MAG: competence protein, partial [Odoribacter sp.]|nr:competence protein [Odoribacter sp.]